MKQLSYEQHAVVSALPTATAALAGTIVRLSTDNKPYWCNGAAWIDISSGASSLLTGYASGAGTVAGTDTVLQGIQKLNGNQQSLVTAYNIDPATGTLRVGVTGAQGNFTNFASNTALWLDMPTTGPSGIGVGGAGSNPWLAYCHVGGEWFTNSNAGDIAYRNTAGRLLFGVDANGWKMALNSGTGGLTINTPVLLGVGSAALYAFNIPTATSLTTVPVSGAIENDGTALYYTDSGASRSPLITSATLSAATLATPLTGYGQTTGSISTSDTILTSIEKIVGNSESPEILVDTTPDTPAAGHLGLSAIDNGKIGLVQIDSSGRIDTIQRALYSNSFVLWGPNSGTTVAPAIGSTWVARNAGTQAAQSRPTPNSTNMVTSMQRNIFGTGTTVTGSSGIQTTDAVAWMGNAAGRGGFFFFARFALETYLASERLFIGLSTNNAALAVEPSTMANSIGIGKDSTDTTLQFITRGAAATKTNTTITPSTTQVYDLYMFSAPNSQSVTFTLRDPSNPATPLASATVNTNMPTNTVFMYVQAHINATTGGTAKQLSLAKMYLETDL